MAKQLREALHRKKHIDAQKNQALTILRLKQVKARTGLSRSTIYALIKKSKFPAQITLCGGRAVGWIEQEICDYLARQIEASREAA